MWPRISIAGLTAGILLLLCIVSSVNSFSKYGRGCNDIGCLPNEECVITSDSCSFTQREGKDCGNYPKCQRKSGSSSASSAPVNPSEHTPNLLSVKSSANESGNLRLKRQSGYGWGGQGMGGGKGAQGAGQGSPNGINGRGQWGNQGGMGIGMGQGPMNGRGRGPMCEQNGMGGQSGMAIGMGQGSMNGQGAMGSMGGMGNGRGPMGGMGWQGVMGMCSGGVPMGGPRGMGGIEGRRGDMNWQGGPGEGIVSLSGQGRMGMNEGQRGPGINEQRRIGFPRYGDGNMGPYNNNGHRFGNQISPRGGTSVQSMSMAGEGSFGNRRFGYGQTMGSVNGGPMYGQYYCNLNGRTYMIDQRSGQQNPNLMGGYGGNGLPLTAPPNCTFLNGYGILRQPSNTEDLNAPTSSTDTTYTTRSSWF